MNEPNSLHKDSHEVSNISSIVTYVLLILGLVAEFFAIEFVIGKATHGFKPAEKGFLTASIIIMLVHQFLTIRNFHILDHIEKSHLKYNQIGDWVGKSRIEDYLRGLIFFVFACLTGEIVYLLIVSSKSIPFIGDKLLTLPLDTDKKLLDLSFLTPFYLVSAVTLSFLLVLWDVLGLIHDRADLPTFKWKWEKYDRIVYYPLSHPYYTYIVGDVFSVIFWGLIILMVGGRLNDPTWVILFFIAYLVIIGVRCYGEWKVNYPKFVLNRKNYLAKSYLWRPKNYLIGSWIKEWEESDKTLSEQISISGDNKFYLPNKVVLDLTEIDFDTKNKTVQFILVSLDDEQIKTLVTLFNIKKGIYLKGTEKNLKTGEMKRIAFKKNIY